MNSVLDKRPKLAAEIERIAEVAGYLWQKGWAERNGGNIVVNITEFVDDELKKLPALAPAIEIGETFSCLKGCFFYCKGTNRKMRDLARHPMDNGCIIRICDDCAHYEMIADNPVKPTSELPSHLGVHNYIISTGSSYKATVHTHPIELVAMSHTEKFLKKDVLTKVLWSMIPETLVFAPLGLGVSRYEMPGSLKLAESLMEQIKTYDVVLWEKHGAFAVGKDVMDAFDQIDVLNKSAQIYMCARNMGFEPDGMTDEAMKEIQEFYKLPKTRVE
ncbi:MAG: rhamnulose-1-phosphate aldolase [Bacteroidales bacterium]|nr:rhamnulose-1-phosphate aldolase [Bacteroidales bacterium]